MAQSLEDAPGKNTITDEARALVWRKSARSIGNGNCIEAARLADGRLAIRDSKDKSGPALLFTDGEWRAFVGGVRDGDFDSL
jgi:Domain of unknown function (DUF397)